MHLDFNGLQAFVAIAERSSFRAAALRLNLTQSALSHRIRKFEDNLGVLLLARTTRQVALTAAGAELLPRAQRILEDMQSAIDRLGVTARQSDPKLCFGCLPTIAMVSLPGVIERFGSRYPDTLIKVFDNSASDIAGRVQAGNADFGITVSAAIRAELDMRPLVQEPFVLLCRRSDPLAERTELLWTDITKLPLVRISAETGNRILIDDALGANKDTLNWRYEVQRITTAVALVGAGIGYAVLPKLACRTVEAGHLTSIRLKAPIVSRTLGVVTPKGEALSQAATHMLELIEIALLTEIDHDSINE